MAVCGGNCMGFANLERRVRALGFYEPKDAPVGGVTFLSHSGSAFSAMIHNDRALGLNLAVSAGQEFVTTVADYLRYALGLESTKAVGLFIETVRDPAGFRDALALGNERDIPVVALKVGREERTRELVAAHSGALAGEDGAYEALFDAYGVSRVESLDEMADTLALFAAGRRAGPGGLASVHDSGGERALLVDAAAAVGVPFAEISDETSERMAALLDPGLPPVNPLDFWGTGRDSHEIITGCVRALLEDPAVAALAFSVDLTSEDYQRWASRWRARPSPRPASRSRCSRTSRAASTETTRSCSTATGSRCSRARSPVSRRSGTCSRIATSVRARRCPTCRPCRWRARAMGRAAVERGTVR